MLPTSYIQIIIELAEEFEVSTVYIFGSSLSEVEYNDIDIGVEGIKSDIFFRFYGQLILRLPKMVDLIDMDTNENFSKYIKETGKMIYG